MTDAQIRGALQLLSFMADTDAFTPTLERYRWALEEVLRLRAELVAPREAKATVGAAEYPITLVVDETLPPDQSVVVGIGGDGKPFRHTITNIGTGKE